MKLNNLTVSKIIGTHTTFFKTRNKLSIKNRSCYGISFAIDGEICYEHNKETYVCDKHHVIFHPKNSTYTLDCYKPGSFIVINFECPENFECKEFSSIHIDNGETFIKLYNRLEKVTLFNSANNTFEQLSLLYKIFSYLFGENNKTSVYPVLKPAIKYIEENIHDTALSNKTLAELCNLSESYFRRLFKTSFGVSPKQYILEARVNKAKALLELDNDKLLSIANECGFSNLYHFLRVFKEKNGCTPTEYKKMFLREIF